PAVFQRQQQVGAWPVDDVAKPRTVTGQEGIGVALGLAAESTNVSRKRIVLSKRGVELKFRQGLVFQLGPAADGIQRKHACGRIGERPVIDDAATEGSAKSADG